MIRISNTTFENNKKNDSKFFITQIKQIRIGYEIIFIMDQKFNKKWEIGTCISIWGKSKKYKIASMYIIDLELFYFHFSLYLKSKSIFFVLKG